MALAATFGLGIAMLVASPAAPASAVPTVRTIHFYPSGSESRHVFMACTATAYSPSVTSTSGAIAAGSVECVYEDGTAANSPHITLDETLISPSNVAVTEPKAGDEIDALAAVASNRSCSHGTWTSLAEAVVDVPLGWHLGPEGTAHVQDMNYTTANLGTCAEDYTFVPNLWAQDPEDVSLILQSYDLRLGTVGCCLDVVHPYLDGEVVGQSIAAGTQVLRGTTVSVTLGWFNPYPCGEFEC